MSLNGLDATNVLEAYQATVTDPGGWFLLRYVSRDGVELLARGKGGVHEARSTIAKYLEQSPLYGLLIYRRRKVLVKYIPEGTSRVLQARTAVHFQDIAERYSPYETLLEITTAEGLNDTSLAAAFPLHTASSSANASRLHEINEDEEDVGVIPKRSSKQSNNNGSIFGTRQYKMERRVEQVMRPDRAPPTVHSLGDGAAPGKTSIASQILVREDSGKHSITSVSSPLSESLTEYTASTVPSETSSSREATSKSSLLSEPLKSQTPVQSTANKYPKRTSSVSPARRPVSPPTTAKDVGARDKKEPTIESKAESKPETTPAVVQESGSQKSTSEPASTHEERLKKAAEEPFDFSYLEPKQKVRLAPRPVASSAQSKRATTSGVSALPAQYRPMVKKHDKQDPMSTSTSLYSASNTLPVVPIPPIPDSTEYNPRPISRGSVRSLTSQKNNVMTPDKIRLMKAVELRKKQLRKSSTNLPSTVPGVGSEDGSSSSKAIPAVPKIAEHLPQQPAQRGVAEQAKQVSEDEAKPAPAQEGESSAVHDQQEALSKLEAASLKDKQPESSRKEGKLTDLPRHVLAEEDNAHKSDSGVEMDDQKATGESSSKQRAHDHREAIAVIPPANDTETNSDTQTPTATPNDINTAEALRNDELKADAEGYGVVPDPEEEEKTRPTLQYPQSPIKEHAANDLASPISDYSDAKTEFPIAIDSAQTASSDHAQEAGEDSSGARNVPTIIMSPGSPQTPQAPEKSIRDSTQAGAEDEDKDVDSQAELDVQQSPRRQNSDLAKRRRGFVEPLAMQNAADGLAVDDDDDFLDELQTADVQEARSMSVSRSPVAAYFPRRPSNHSLVSAKSHPSDAVTPRVTAPSTRDVSPVPVEPASTASMTVPRDVPHRDVSPLETDRSGDSYIGLRRNVSSGIAKRFQALSETSYATAQYAGSPDRNSRDAARTRATSLKGRWGLGDRTNSASSPAGRPETAPTWSLSQDGSGKHESINVRARIVRPSAGLSGHSEQTEPADAAQLQSSNIEIRHGGEPQSTKILPSLNTDVSPQERRARGQAFSPKSAVPEDFPKPPQNTARTQQATPTSDDTSTIGSKTDSRATRFFKRMSNLGGMRRHVPTAPATPTTPTLQHPAINESSISVKSTNTPSTITEQDHPDMPPAAALGDLNVQFPDTLLWKRRWLTLDDAGNLILGTTSNLDNQRGAPPRKYHLSEYKMPHIPDLERQELPHSVCLELNEGGTLQIACEDAMGQRQVLTMLRTYWKSWVG